MSWVVNKVSKTIGALKRGLFSLKGRVTLIQACLYLCSSLCAESIEVYEKILMGEGREEHKDHSLELGCRSKNSDGLDIRNLKLKNLYLLAKWL